MVLVQCCRLLMPWWQKLPGPRSLPFSVLCVFLHCDPVAAILLVFSHVDSLILLLFHQKMNGSVYRRRMALMAISDFLDGGWKSLSLFESSNRFKIQNYKVRFFILGSFPFTINKHHGQH